MLKKNTQDEYFSKRLKAVKSHIIKFSENKNPEELHGLRVEVKKLRALVLLIERCTTLQFLSLSLKPLKKIYKLAGSMREADINVKLLDSYRISSDVFKANQMEMVNILSSEFSSRIGSHLRTVDEILNMLIVNTFDIKTDSIQSEIHNQVEILNRVFLKDDFLNELHECRKRLKNIMYLLAILTKRLKDKLMLNRVYIDNLQGLIGKWHDVFRTKQILIENGVTNQMILETLDAENEKLLARVKTRVKNFGRKVKLRVKKNQSL